MIDDASNFKIGANSMENVVKLSSANKLYKYPTIYGNLHLLTNLIPDSIVYADLKLGKVKLPLT